MATASTLLCEDQLLCSICLDVFTDPVTTPCGHNFCKKCITQHWDSDLKSQCPMCKEPLKDIAELRVNTLISEVAAQLRQSGEKKERRSSEQHEDKAREGEILCDVCTDTKLKALKSCLVCLTSYCQAHLELHKSITVGKKHILTDPVENLESRMCKKHERPLELFCKTDQICVCQSCTESHLDHYGHKNVPLIEEYDRKKADLQTRSDDTEEKICKRREKMEEIQQCVKLTREDANKVTAASFEACKALIASVEAGLAQLIETIEERQQKIEKHAESLVKILEEEIFELMKSKAEVVQLCCTKDHLSFLKNFSSLSPLPDTKDWTVVRGPLSHTVNMKNAVTNLMKTVSEETHKLLPVTELKRAQLYAVDVTLDPETAHPALILSDDGKQIRRGDVSQKLPDSPKRFADYIVLGKQGLSSGKFYFEVQVGKKTEWALGVARESVSREYVTLTTKNGFWALELINGKKYEVTAPCPVLLKNRAKTQKVGMFVSYEEGLVSFYDVGAAELIYSFTGCKFNEKLFPFINPGHTKRENSAPLIICPVDKP